MTQSWHAALSHFNFICVKNAVQEWPLCGSWNNYRSGFGFTRLLIVQDWFSGNFNTPQTVIRPPWLVENASLIFTKGTERPDTTSYKCSTAKVFFSVPLPLLHGRILFLPRLDMLTVLDTRSEAKLKNVLDQERTSQLFFVLVHAVNQRYTTQVTSTKPRLCQIRVRR